MPIPLLRWRGEAPTIDLRQPSGHTPALFGGLAVQTHTFVPVTHGSVPAAVVGYGLCIVIAFMLGRVFAHRKWDGWPARIVSFSLGISALLFAMVRDGEDVAVPVAAIAVVALVFGSAKLLTHSYGVPSSGDGHQGAGVPAVMACEHCS